MKELWTAQVHLLTPPAEFGDTKCCTNVVAWADDKDDFAATVAGIFERRSWTILSVHQCKRVADCEVVIEELAEQIERAKMEPDSFIFGTLHYYPSKPA
jgi:2-oxo-4-hydroxy-4-carboxy--5-ureidoimidazoline (OHCU) decarboxylase